MKTVLIHGQNHVGSSCQIGRLLAEQLSKPEEITEFFLPRDLNHFCTGCGRCLDGDERCPFCQEKQKIMDAIEAGDVLIFTTPTYCMRASAPMKAFIDLTFTAWMVHRPRASMFRKKAVVISTAAGAGTGSAIKDVKNALTYWGVPEIHSLGFAVQAMGWDLVRKEKKQQIQHKVDVLARKLNREKPVKVGIKTRFLFTVMGKMQAAGMGASPFEKEYWQAMGWLGKARPWRNSGCTTGKT